MDGAELEKKAKDALVAAGDMASRGAKWLRGYRETHRAPQADKAVHEGDWRVYGVTSLAPQNMVFRAFNAFRLMIPPR